MPIDHVTFATSAFEETCYFFRTVLQFDILEPLEKMPCQSACFDCGDGHAVHILEVEQTPPIDDGEFTRHVAFHVPMARWLRIRQTLQSEKVEIREPEQENGISHFFVNDPNGYLLEFICRG